MSDEVIHKFKLKKVVTISLTAEIDMFGVFFKERFESFVENCVTELIKNLLEPSVSSTMR